MWIIDDIVDLVAVALQATGRHVYSHRDRINFGLLHDGRLACTAIFLEDRCEVYISGLPHARIFYYYDPEFPDSLIAQYGVHHD